jgi:cytoskeletal protein CcmA (bactofilin family)
MWGRSSNGSELNGLLDAGSLIQGALHFDDEFQVNGRINGSVVSNGHLIVGERGEVEGEIKVGRISIAGIVRGAVRAERIELTSKARVYADLHTPVLTVEEGALFEGRCFMEKTQKAEADNVTPIKEGRNAKGAS